MTTKEDKLVPAKRKLFYSLVDFVNVCSSVGSNSDKNLKNQVTREIEYYSDSKRAKKLTTSGWPTKQEFESAKTAALNAAKNLANIEDYNDVETDKRVGKYTAKEISRVYYDELDYDKLEYDIHKTKRPNADIFDTFYPIINGLNSKKESILKTAFKEGSTTVKDVINKMRDEVALDHMSRETLGPEQNKVRFNRMKSALDSDIELKKARRDEYALDSSKKDKAALANVLRKGSNATEEEKKSAKSEFDSSNYIKKTKFQTKWQDFCKDAGIDTLTTKELINHIKNGVSFKLFGALRGRGEQGELVIGNAPSKHDKPANVNGENIFRVQPKIISLLKKEGAKEGDINKYANKVEIKNKDAAFKAKVNEAIGLGTVKESFENAFNILLEEFFK